MEVEAGKTGAERLRAWLEARGLSQSWLARLLGTSTGALNHYLLGRRAFPPLEAWAVEGLTEGAVTARELLLSPEEARDPLAVCLRRAGAEAGGEA